MYRSLLTVDSVMIILLWGYWSIIYKAWHVTWLTHRRRSHVHFHHILRNEKLPVLSVMCPTGNGRFVVLTFEPWAAPVCHDSFMFAMTHVCCDMTHAFPGNALQVTGGWLITHSNHEQHLCAMTHLCVPWLIHVCHCAVTWLNHSQEMLHR